MTIEFGYEKNKVLQALRYHFISFPEIRIMIILVNVFALLSIVLYALGKVGSLPFLVGSTLWVVLLLSFWFFLPYIIYRKTITFRHQFAMDFEDSGFTLRHERGSRKWGWESLKRLVESPHFFHLYFDARSFILVPKDACPEIEEVRELRKLIKSKLAKA
jgi:hypothetical protein